MGIASPELRHFNDLNCPLLARLKVACFEYLTEVSKSKQRHQLVMLLKRFDCAILNTLANIQGLGLWGKHDLGKRTHSSFRLEAPGISTSHDNESNEIIFCNSWKV